MEKGDGILARPIRKQSMVGAVENFAMRLIIDLVENIGGHHGGRGIGRGCQLPDLLFQQIERKSRCLAQMQAIEPDICGGGIAAPCGGQSKRGKTLQQLAAVEFSSHCIFPVRFRCGWVQP